MKKKILLLCTMALFLMSCGTENKQEKSKATETKAKTVKKLAVNPAMKNGGTINLATTGKFEGKFNPTIVTTNYDSTVNGYIFETLVTYGNDFIYKPGTLTKSYEYDKDKLQYTFHMKEGVKFSDGKELTSADVKFTYSLFARPEYTGRNGYAVVSLKGYDDVKNGKSRYISGIETPDKYTVIFKLKEANAKSLNNFVTSIIPKHYYEYANKDEYKTKFLNKSEKPIGSGPYELTEYKPGEYVVLDRFKDYHMGGSDIKKIIIKLVPADSLSAALANGSLDISGIGGRKSKEKQIAESTGLLNFQKTLPSGYDYIGFNLRNPKFQDKTLRHALAYGLNRKLYAERVLEGYATVINQPLVPQHWARSNDVNPYEYNPEKANKLLEEDGWKKGKDGFRYKDGEKLGFNLETTASYGQSSTGKTWLALIKQNWKAIGVDVEIKLTDFNAMVKDMYSDNPKYETLMLSWSTIADPDQTNGFGTGGSNNVMNYSNPTVDRLLKEGLREMDLEKRKVIYHKIMNEINEDLPYIFTTSGTGVIGVNKRIEGLDYKNDINLIEGARTGVVTIKQN